MKMLHAQQIALYVCVTVVALYALFVAQQVTETIIYYVTL